MQNIKFAIIILLLSNLSMVNAADASTVQKIEANDDDISSLELVENIKKAIELPADIKTNETINIDHGRISGNINLNSRGKQQNFATGISINVSESPEDEEMYALEDYVNEGYDAALAGQLEVATFFYKKALEVDKKNTNIQYSLATIYHKQNEYAQAKKYYNQVLKNDPKHFKALNNLLALMGQENPRKALASLNELAQVNPSYSPLQAQIAMVLLELGDVEAAEAHLRKAVTIDPIIPQYRYNLALLYERKKKFKLAVQLYNSLLNDAYRGVELPVSADTLQRKITKLSTKQSS